MSRSVSETIEEMFDWAVSESSAYLSGDLVDLSRCLKKTLETDAITITRSWYGNLAEHSMEAMIRSLQVRTRVNSKLQRKDELYARFTYKLETWNDFDVYSAVITSGNGYKSASKWIDNHGNSDGEDHVDKKLDYIEYVYDLQVDEGIIGLPKETVARKDIHWTNQYFHQQVPFSIYYMMNPTWDNLITDAFAYGKKNGMFDILKF